MFYFNIIFGMPAQTGIPFYPILNLNKLLMRILYIIIFTSIYLPNSAQNSSNKFTCEDLKSILEFHETINHFQWLTRPNDSLTIVDTLGFFKCTEIKILNKPTIIVNKYTSEIKFGDRSFANLKGRKNDYLVLYRIEDMTHGYLFRFWQANDNANIGIIAIKKKKLKLKLKDIGVF